MVGDPGQEAHQTLTKQMGVDLIMLGSLQPCVMKYLMLAFKDFMV